MGTQFGCNHKQTLCWDCANACGDCSWSRTPDHIPVEGWEAERRDIHKKGVAPVESYIVISCPEFIRDARNGGAFRV